MSGHGRKSTPGGVARITPQGTIIGRGLDERKFRELLESDYEVMGFIAHVSEIGEAGIFRLPDGNAIEYRPNRNNEKESDNQ